MIPTAKQYAKLKYEDKRKVIKTLTELLARYAETERPNND